MREAEEDERGSPKKISICDGTPAVVDQRKVSADLWHALDLDARDVPSAGPIDAPPPKRYGA